MPQIIITKGPAAGAQYAFDGQAVIGRGSAADISVEEPGISRRHARITPGDGGWVLSDLQSANGTFVRGRRLVEPVLLKGGDRFALASIEFELKLEDTSARELHYREGEAQPVVGAVNANRVSDLLFSQAGKGGDAVAGLQRRLQLMYDVGEALASTLNEDALLQEILIRIFDVFPGVERGAVLVLSEDREQLLPRISRTREGKDVDVAVSRTMVWDAIDNRRAILSLDAAHDERFAAAQTVQSLALRAVACVPMLFRDEVFGVIHLDGPDPHKAIPADDLPLLMGIGSQAGMGISHARFHARAVTQELVSQDLAMARRIQARFLPTSPPAVERWEFWGESRAALEVGGDYYDYSTLDDGRVMIAVGDVSGKGVSGALYMARLSSEIRYQSGRAKSAVEIVERVNTTMSRELEAGMFVTLVVCALDSRTGEMEIVNAGHNPPLLRHSGGEVEPVEVPKNVPLGVLEDREFEATRCVLLPGETLVLYTDGISEAMNTASEEFGMKRFIREIALAGTSAAEIGESVLTAVEKFAGEAPPNDDLTIVCFGAVSKDQQSKVTDRVQIPS